MDRFDVLISKMIFLKKISLTCISSWKIIKKIIITTLPNILYIKKNFDWFAFELSFSPNKTMVDNLIEFWEEKKKVRKDMELKLGCV